MAAHAVPAVPCPPSVTLTLCRRRCLPQKGVVDTQLIAHDKEVYDIAWGGVGVFASVSADGSVRVFDLRRVLTPLTKYSCLLCTCRA